MLKIAALLSARSDASAARASALARSVCSGSLALDHGEAAVRGLVVSEVTSHLTDAKSAQALVQVWAEGTENGTALLEQVLPAKDRGGVVVDAWVVRELVFRQPIERQSLGVAPNGVKLAGTAYKRDDFTREAFFDYWKNVHAHISGHLPGVGGYVVSEVREQLSGEISPDALLEIWYPDKATFEAAGAAPEQAAAWEDVPRYAKTTGTFWLMHETVIAAPPPTGPGTLEVEDA